MKKIKVRAAGSSSCSCCTSAADSNCCTGTATHDCCTQKVERPYRDDAGWVTGRLTTQAGSIAQVSTTLSMGDIMGTWKARWGIGRMSYKIDPGLYCVGTPDSDSPVLVTANYKMSFDRLRKELSGLNTWILVLDTKGINVWCAAGEGTFGTEEIINRIAAVNLSEIVVNRTIILPQLGAPGVSAHEVKKYSGFKVVYGPVRAADVKAFIAAGMEATPEMRTVKFTLIDRLVLTPMEVVGSIKPAVIIFGILFILNSIGFGKYGLTDLYAYIGAILVGCVITPVLLPWIPGRAFSFKGALLGLIWAATVNMLNGFPGLASYSLSRALAYMLILPVLSSYGAMNFTGCSTFTSPSGVNREMKTAIPAMLVAAALGVILLIIEGFINILS